MERLHDIGTEVTTHSFRVESWEIARKDGGVFMHFSYIPPPEPERDSVDLSSIAGLPDLSAAYQTSPGALFLPTLVDAAKKHGGWPSWVGQWWADWTGGSRQGVPGHKIYSQRKGVTSVGEEDDLTVVKGSGAGMRGIQAAAGGGRIWVVKGRQWTEVSTPKRMMADDPGHESISFLEITGRV